MGIPQRAPLLYRDDARLGIVHIIARKFVQGEGYNRINGGVVLAHIVLRFEGYRYIGIQPCFFAGNVSRLVAS